MLTACGDVAWRGEDGKRLGEVLMGLAALGGAALFVPLFTPLFRMWWALGMGLGPYDGERVGVAMCGRIAKPETGA